MSWVSSAKLNVQCSASRLQSSCLRTGHLQLADITLEIGQSRKAKPKVVSSREMP